MFEFKLSDVQKRYLGSLSYKNPFSSFAKLKKYLTEQIVGSGSLLSLYIRQQRRWRSNIHGHESGRGGLRARPKKARGRKTGSRPYPIKPKIQKVYWASGPWARPLPYVSVHGTQAQPRRPSGQHFQAHAMEFYARLSMVRYSSKFLKLCPSNDRTLK
jgi:hypothetical protein